MFAGLFLDVKNSNPARVYLSFVLTRTNYLVLLMALLLSAFSLPNDIKNRTIYTVVTKPIRASEIVLGRTLGFAAVGTAMLVAMGLISYFFVRRGLTHDHAIDAAADLVEENTPDGKVAPRRDEHRRSSPPHRRRSARTARARRTSSTGIGTMSSWLARADCHRPRRPAARAV